jgi:hypothetical protein
MELPDVRRDFVSPRFRARGRISRRLGKGEVRPTRTELPEIQFKVELHIFFPFSSPFLVFDELTSARSRPDSSSTVACAYSPRVRGSGRKLNLVTLAYSAGVSNREIYRR